MTYSAGSITDGDEIFEAIRVVVQKLFDDKLNSLVKEFQSVSFSKIIHLLKLRHYYIHNFFSKIFQSIINLAVTNMKINLKATDGQIEQWMNSFFRNLLENVKKKYCLLNTFFNRIILF